MPPAKLSRKQPRRHRRISGVLVAVAILLLCGAGYFIVDMGQRAVTANNVQAGNSAMTSMPAPAVPTVLAAAKHIYSETADPKADIDAARKQAKDQHKRVLLDFGGDWCGDCQVLDIYFHQPPNAELLDRNFVLVHVWIGHMDMNLDVAAKYGVPINRGVPALAVLNPDGSVIYAQATGEFNDMRHMEPDSVTGFLNKWKS